MLRGGPVAGKARFHYKDILFARQAGRRLRERNFCIARIAEVQK
jgi:hypothetical protein